MENDDRSTGEDAKAETAQDIIGRNRIAKYRDDPIERERLDRVFTYHGVKDDQPPRYEAIRGHARSLAHLIMVACPPSRERSTALTRLEEAVMHANAAIARNE
jgi:hypothetical protein